MTDLLLRLYGYLQRHRLTAWLGALALTLLLVLSVMRLGYKEDISDFLPVDSQHQQALQVYQDISGADKIFAVFQSSDTLQADPDRMVQAVDDFTARVEQADTAHALGSVLSEVDMEQTARVAEFVYTHIPYFLTDADYRRMDSVLSRPGYVAERLSADKQLLLFPTGGLLSDNIQRDPLGLFTPVVQRLQRSDSSLRYELYDGHIFSPDMSRAIVMMTSPYGSSETEHNDSLARLLRTCADSTQAVHPTLQVHIIGGPVIAVGNARQIKHDSLLAVAISVALILALLLFSFRSVRPLLLIVLSIGWGWLFAMGGLSLFHDSVSIIVIGISSVIVGIAVNYPLHFLAHLSHTPDRRKALREIVMPLLVGNVTTVGAFLALVPLQSAALRDLGLFSALLLVGTILFVLVFLPHLAREGREPQSTLLGRLSAASPDTKPAVVAVVAVLTLVLGWFSLDTRFDANMAHINYMTDEQKADMAYFQRTMTSAGQYQTLYAVSRDSTLDGALAKSQRLQPRLDSMAAAGRIHAYTSCSPFITSRAEQQRRLDRWDDFCRRHRDLEPQLTRAMQAEGFAAGSFDDFTALLHSRWKPQDARFFAPLAQTVFASCFSHDKADGSYSVVNTVSLADRDLEAARTALQGDDAYCFDVASMNSAIASRLSDDFNYIGFACSCIVFFFLWASMGSIELAAISFVPMAVSWLWILGIMALCGMQFNIVNVILATFIFGQGDDYTIFMTEGSMYEYAYRRKMLGSYKHSIILSALIMFIGIGTLVVARHPALRSLAEVTIAGMFSVVLMAYIFPPLLFRWLVQCGGRYRRRPLTLAALVRGVWTLAVRGRLGLVPGVKVTVQGQENTASGRPCLFVCQSLPERPMMRRLMGRRGGVELSEEALEKARRGQLRVQPVVIHGLDDVMPAGSVAVYRGCVTVRLLPCIDPATADTETLRQQMAAEQECLMRHTATAAYYRDLVLDRYRYKDTGIYRAVKASMAKSRCFTDLVDVPEEGPRVVFRNDSYGQLPLLYALVHPRQQVVVEEANEELRALITHCADDLGNLQCVAPQEY